MLEYHLNTVLPIHYLCYLQCLLVKGWKSGSSWSFPRGKKSKHEEDHDCAIREVMHDVYFFNIILSIFFS